MLGRDNTSRTSRSAGFAGPCWGAEERCEASSQMLVRG